MLYVFVLAQFIIVRKASASRGREGGKEERLTCGTIHKRVKIDYSQQVLRFLELEHCNQPNTYNNFMFLRSCWSEAVKG
uniref:Secreted protein n=1 Tax=Setaria viridis TaxID=4556 RepID=A0A4U6UDL6_SETVI|nr:hypothetical protein SEVIR_5G048933v2 [Setaria viridis]